MSMAEYELEMGGEGECEVRGAVPDIG